MFNLLETVREQLTVRDSDLTVVQRVVAATPDEEVRAAYERSVYRYIMWVQNDDARRTLQALDPSPSDARKGHRAEERTGIKQPGISRATAAAGAALRGRWDILLGRAVACEGGLKPFRDMTAADCAFQARMRKYQAEKTQKQSDAWALLGRTIQASGRETVGDVPSDVLGIDVVEEALAA